MNFPYGASVEDARQKLAYDLYYVRNRSVVLDLLILLATVRVILFVKALAKALSLCSSPQPRAVIV